MQYLKDALGIKQGEVISLAGGGGKTTAMFTLAAELAREKVLVTTTTKINFPSECPVTLAASLEDAVRQSEKHHKGIMVLGRRRVGEKLHGIPPQWVDVLKKYFPFILVEADGAARRPLKGYAEYEPVIPSSATLVTAVAGMSVVGKPLNDQFVHRSQLVTASTGFPGESEVTTWLLANIQKELVGRIRQQAPYARRILLLNQLGKKDIDKYRRLGEYLAESCYDVVLAGSLLPSVHLERITKGARLPVAGIILAAGSSTRMGDRNKLLLPWKNKTIIRHVAEGTIQAVGEKTIVVLGHEHELVRQELAGLPVTFVVNENYKQGQSGSLRKGLEAVNGHYAGAMFVLGDQPSIPPQLFSGLLTAFQLEAPPAVYPLYNGRRGNPVIFHKDLFPNLKTITGDRGGRQVLNELGNKALAVPTVFKQVVQDIDTYSDWTHLTGEEISR